MPFTICSFYSSGYLVVLILFLSILSHVLLARCARAHTVSPCPLRPPPSPRFHPPLALNWYTNSRSKYLLFTSFTL